MIPTFVFVHGSGGSARSWSAVQQSLALRGHRGVAVDLPGRGAGFSRAYYEQDLAALAAEPTELAGVTADDVIGHVVDTVRQVRAHGSVVLVGHSFGGLVLTAVGNAVPELIERIVYVSAQCPVNSSAAAYLTRPEWADTELFAAVAPILVGDPAELGCIRVNWLGADRAGVGALRRAIGAELTDEQFRLVISTSQPDEYFWQSDPAWDRRADRETWGRIPRTFVRLADDRALPPAAQDLYIAEADALTPDNPFDVHTIKASHSGFLRYPDELVDILTGTGPTTR